MTGSIAAGLVRCVDLLGMYGTPMQMTPGWLEADSAPFRVAEITLPVVLNDMWIQSL